MKSYLKNVVAPPLKVWIIIPIFNRRDLTLECLATLQEQDILTRYEVIVCDGGSSDGSVEAINERFPSVLILEGKWWWMEGIRAGMEYAKSQNADIFVWLNDDCLPAPGAFDSLILHTCTTGHISGGITHTHEGAYSGMNRGFWGLKPIDISKIPQPGHVLKVDSLVGNFVAIPSICVQRIGLPNAALFPHIGGDSYYTLELTQNGFECYLVGSAQAIDSHGGNLSSGFSILRGDNTISYYLKRQFTFDPKFGILPQLRLSRRFWGFRGWLVALLPWIKDLILIFLRIILPRSIRLRI